MSFSCWYYYIKYTVETLLNAEENWSDYDNSIFYDQYGEIPDDENIMLPAEARRILLKENASGLSQEYQKEVTEAARNEGDTYNWILYHNGQAVGGMTEEQAAERNEDPVV